MLPDVEGQPCPSHRPERGGQAVVLRSAVPPYISVVMSNPSPRAIHAPGHLTSVGYHTLEMRKQGHMQPGEAADLGRPVVHFCVDIDCIFTVPRGRVVLIPDALEIQRHTAGTAA